MCGELGERAGQPAPALGMVGLSSQEGSGKLQPLRRAQESSILQHRHPALLQ